MPYRTHKNDTKQYQTQRKHINEQPRSSTKNIQYNITKTSLYNFDPFKPHFYIVKLGLIGVYIIFLIFTWQQIVGTR